MCWPCVSGVVLLEVVPGVGAARPGAWRLVPEGSLGRAGWQDGTIPEGENTPPPLSHPCSWHQWEQNCPSTADSIAWCRCSLQLGLSCGSRLGGHSPQGGCWCSIRSSSPDTAQHYCHLVDVYFHIVILTLPPQPFPHHALCVVELSPMPLFF